MVYHAFKHTRQASKRVLILSHFYHARVRISRIYWLIKNISKTNRHKPLLKRPNVYLKIRLNLVKPNTDELNYCFNQKFIVLNKSIYRKWFKPKSFHRFSRGSTVFINTYTQPLTGVFILGGSHTDIQHRLPRARTYAATATDAAAIYISH